MNNMGLFGFVKKDAAKSTGSSSKSVSRAWHQARSDSGVRSGRDKSHFKSAPSWASKKTGSGVSFFRKGK